MTIALMVFLVLNIIGCYPAGKDTEKCFGNCRFEIARVYAEGRECNVLVDNKRDEDLIHDVYCYYERDNIVYLFGAGWEDKDKYYAVLDYERGKFGKYYKLEDAPEAFRNILAKLPKNKSENIEVYFDNETSNVTIK